MKLIHAELALARSHVNCVGGFVLIVIIFMGLAKALTISAGKLWSPLRYSAMKPSKLDKIIHAPRHVEKRGSVILKLLRNL
jgi:hypothetical protein